MDRSRAVWGRDGPTSLRDVGYSSIGLDDSWQACGQGLNGSFHSKDGVPLVNDKFPNMSAMNEKAHLNNLTSGWYLNNCICPETGKLQPNWLPQMQGDVAALIRYGFDEVKLDSCGPSKDIALWERLINGTGKAIMIENCANNKSFFDLWQRQQPSTDGALLDPKRCPFNFYRSGSDGRATWDRMIRNLESQTTFERFSQPGCWSYADMLEAGLQNPQLQALRPESFPDPAKLFTQQNGVHMDQCCVLQWEGEAPPSFTTLGFCPNRVRDRGPKHLHAFWSPGSKWRTPPVALNRMAMWSLRTFTRGRQNSAAGP